MELKLKSVNSIKINYRGKKLKLNEKILWTEEKIPKNLSRIGRYFHFVLDASWMKKRFTGIRPNFRCMKKIVYRDLISWKIKEINENSHFAEDCFYRLKVLTLPVFFSLVSGSVVSIQTWFFSVLNWRVGLISTTATSDA